VTKKIASSQPDTGVAANGSEEEKTKTHKPLFVFQGKVGG